MARWVATFELRQICKQCAENEKAWNTRRELEKEREREGGEGQMVKKSFGQRRTVSHDVVNATIYFTIFSSH